MDSFDFWRFSLWLYRQDGVAPACLHLQEGHGVDVNILLFSLWLGHCGKTADAATLAALSTEASDWHVAVVLPLRAVRRHLKTVDQPDIPEASTSYRDRIKADEIHAEQIEQRLLFAAAQRRFGPGLCVADGGDGHADAALANALAYLDLLGAHPSAEEAALIAQLAGRVPPAGA
ncbi:TIGR02444 family protein [Thetidibacter halocola]|uniref:TIGR02444 family protein n=1 Tax=Thetidibacter halocola TaxID=2827239 RepID=A0A8J7WFX8_9RHOB|nr:TIGR02444 family protein [Thetidibacter halocola]MBS0124333.1 TIGR02444 family protein [Thetidibacter halocola]